MESRQKNFPSWKNITKFLQSLFRFQPNFLLLKCDFFSSCNFVVKFSFFCHGESPFSTEFSFDFRKIPNFSLSAGHKFFLTGHGEAHSGGGRCPRSATLSPGPSSAPVFGRGRSSRRHGTGLPRRCCCCWPQIYYFSYTHIHKYTRANASGPLPWLAKRFQLALRNNPDFPRRKTLLPTETNFFFSPKNSFFFHTNTNSHSWQGGHSSFTPVIRRCAGDHGTERNRRRRRTATRSRTCQLKVC